MLKLRVCLLLIMMLAIPLITILVEPGIINSIITGALNSLATSNILLSYSSGMFIGAFALIGLIPIFIVGTLKEIKPLPLQILYSIFIIAAFLFIIFVLYEIVVSLQYYSGLINYITINQKPIRLTFNGSDNTTFTVNSTKVYYCSQVLYKSAANDSTKAYCNGVNMQAKPLLISLGLSYSCIFFALSLLLADLLVYSVDLVFPKKQER